MHSRGKKRKRSLPSAGPTKRRVPFWREDDGGGEPPPPFVPPPALDERRPSKAPESPPSKRRSAGGAPRFAGPPPKKLGSPPLRPARAGPPPPDATEAPMFNDPAFLALQKEVRETGLDHKVRFWTNLSYKPPRVIDAYALPKAPISLNH